MGTILSNYSNIFNNFDIEELKQELQNQMKVNEILFDKIKEKDEIIEKKDKIIDNVNILEYRKLLHIDISDEIIDEIKIGELLSNNEIIILKKI